MINIRRNFRLRKLIEIYWKIDEQTLANKGQVDDLSLSGLRLEFTGNKPKYGDVLFLDCPDIPALPKRAKLKWVRALPNQKGYVCGLVFVKENSDYTDAWKKWMEGNIANFADVGDNKILGKYLEHGDD